MKSPITFHLDSIWWECVFKIRNVIDELSL